MCGVTRTCRYVSVCVCVAGPAGGHALAVGIGQARHTRIVLHTTYTQHTPPPHTHLWASARQGIHAHIQHTPTPTPTHTSGRRPSKTYIHAYIHTHTHTCGRGRRLSKTYKHTYIHTHTCGVGVGQAGLLLCWPDAPAYLTQAVTGALHCCAGSEGAASQLAQALQPRMPLMWTRLSMPGAQLAMHRAVWQWRCQQSLQSSQIMQAGPGAAHGFAMFVESLLHV